MTEPPELKSPPGPHSYDKTAPFSGPSGGLPPPSGPPPVAARPAGLPPGLPPPPPPGAAPTQGVRPGRVTGPLGAGRISQFAPPPRGWQALPLFASMAPEAREQFRGAMEPIRYRKGDTVLRQGEPGDAMFVVESGTLRITVRDNKNTVVFEKTTAAPALVGEMALITQEPRSATVTAEEDTVCLRVSKAAVEDMFHRHPNTGVLLTRLVGERLLEAKGIRKVGKYEIVGRLGAGGMATVFEARHPELGRSVALKMLSHALVSDPSFRETFEHEARLVAQLNHENIVRVMDTEKAYGTMFIVMEKLTGDLLEGLIERGEPMDWDNARRILREISDALGYSHKLGLVHRDIKPANVFLTTEGRVKLLDFGIASQAGGADKGGKVLGTPYYMSPEQILGHALDGRSDLYSLGMLAYELVTRELPHDADTLDQLWARHMTVETPDPRETNPDVPEDLCEFIRRAGMKKPEDRYSSCAEAAAYLKVASEVPVLDRFAMSTLSVTYHVSRKDTVEGVLREAEAKLAGLSGVVLFHAHRDAQA
ncbi:MAG: cyclic nucleotide-binding domain-containing protein [Myxococcales bacterium]|nr:cyclic nucleotide-binding domain-containing protein [Myxococcales bacterium]